MEATQLERSRDRRDRGRACRNNEFVLQRDELLRESLYRLDIGYRPTSVDPDVAALRPAELLESLPERRMNRSARLGAGS